MGHSPHGWRGEPRPSPSSSCRLPHHPRAGCARLVPDSSRPPGHPQSSRRGRAGWLHSPHRTRVKLKIAAAPARPPARPHPRVPAGSAVSPGGVGANGPGRRRRAPCRSKPGAPGTQTRLARPFSSFPDLQQSMVGGPGGPRAGG
jgi:hypothetical protein